jgi:hypothetical protein
MAPANPDDVKQVHALQDAIKVEQKQQGTLELPEWDPVGQKKVREALLVLGSTMPDFKHAFGTKDQVDPIRHLIGTALGWGGNPDKDAIYLDAYALNNVTAKKGADGSIAIQFGGCDGAVPNCLPTTPGWNYTVRLYRPRAEILDGSWKFPDPQPLH